MRLDIDKDGIINFTIKDGGKVEKLVAPIDLKKFYNDLHNQLVNKKFTDVLDDPFKGGFLDNQVKSGEFIEAKSNENRTGDMYEQKLHWITNPDNTHELELVWKAKRKSIHTQFGWYEVKIDMVCRRIMKKEILGENNSKKTVDFGAYEFRNSIIYKNNIIPEKLNKMFLIKNNETLKNIFLEKTYGKMLEVDFQFGIEKIYPMIYSVIDKHFKN